MAAARAPFAEDGAGGVTTQQVAHVQTSRSASPPQWACELTPQPVAVVFCTLNATKLTSDGQIPTQPRTHAGAERLATGKAAGGGVSPSPQLSRNENETKE